MQLKNRTPTSVITPTKVTDKFQLGSCNNANFTDVRPVLEFLIAYQLKSLGNTVKDSEGCLILWLASRRHAAE